MIWFIYFSVLALVSVIAIVVQRRNRDEVIVNSFEAPLKVDRNDFENKNAEYLVVIFSSQTCNSCENVLAKANVLQSDAVDVVNVDFTNSEGRLLHEKYEIEAVPTTVICDSNGVVQESYIGPVTATDLWAGLAKSRGAQIDNCSNH